MAAWPKWAWGAVSSVFVSFGEWVPFPFSAFSSSSFEQPVDDDDDDDLGGREGLPNLSPSDMISAEVGGVTWIWKQGHDNIRYGIKTKIQDN